MEIIQLFPMALQQKVGLRITAPDTKATIQVLHATKRRLGGDTSIPLRFVVHNSEIWIVHPEFVKGQTFNAEKARQALEAHPPAN